MTAGADPRPTVTTGRAGAGGVASRGGAGGAGGGGAAGRPGRARVRRRGGRGRGGGEVGGRRAAAPADEARPGGDVVGGVAPEVRGVGGEADRAVGRHVGPP